MSAAAAISPGIDLFQSDQYSVNRYLNQSPELQAEPESSLVDEAIRYAVFGKAQRIRPVMALRIGRLVRAPQEITLRTGAAVELVHCASLILDDLPCMDNAMLRRGRPAVHVKYGEAAAILAAFTLVTRAVSSLCELSYTGEVRDEIAAFQCELLRSLNSAGLIAGQALDLRLGNQARNSRALAELKTVPLFTLSASAGLVGAQVDRSRRKALMEFGRQFGLAYQIADDWQDGDAANAGVFQNRVAKMLAICQQFGSDGHELESMVDYLSARGPLAQA